MTLTSAGGFRLNFHESGNPDGPPVLLIHGGGTWLYSFRHLFAPLAASGCRVLLLTQQAAQGVFCIAVWTGIQGVPDFQKSPKNRVKNFFKERKINYAE